MANQTPENATEGEPVIHGTLEMLDDRVSLRFELNLDHAVESVWWAVSGPDELRRWFPGAVGWTPEAEETFEAGGAMLEVTEVDAPHHLASTYAGQLQSFELAGEGDGCKFAFVHVFDDFPLAAQTAAGWETISRDLTLIFAMDI